MPTVFTIWGFRFFFYADEHLPIHIHVEKGGARAKYNVVPVIELVENRGFKNTELKKIESVVEAYKELIIDNWKSFHGE
ncbi:MAG: DUF4160 domain-containing protein [Bacteroidetes bacterium]|nr:DUF4160 domain-containing protein [Bacteroidota bacterium]